MCLVRIFITWNLLLEIYNDIKVPVCTHSSLPFNGITQSGVVIFSEMKITLSNYFFFLFRFLLFKTKKKTILGIHTVRIRQLHVPMAIHKGSSVQVHCEFELQHSLLYSVKYYKDYIEFYR